MLTIDWTSHIPAELGELTEFIARGEYAEAQNTETLLLVIGASETQIETAKRNGARARLRSTVAV